MNHQIAMYFGHALLGNPRHEEIEARAIEWGCSIEFAILEDFDWLFTRTFKVHEDSSTFNLLFTFTVKKFKTVKDSDGSSKSIEMQKRVRPWWFVATEGKVCVNVRYGAKLIELAKGI